MDIRIEPIKNEELEILVQLSRTTFTETFSDQNTKEDLELFFEKTFRPEMLQAEMEDSHHYFYLARVGTSVTGYLKLSTAKISGADKEDTLEISRIYVLKEYLGSGVGKALMNFALSVAEKMKKRFVYLGVWERNERAIGFYRKFGFEKCGEHVFMVGSDPQTDWLMQKDLEGSRP